MIAQLDTEFLKLGLKKIWTRISSYFLFEGRPLTTKGRWINPFVKLFFKLILILPGNKKLYKPIFIIGLGRSGTTILGKVMGTHKQLGFLNEPKIIWNKIYPFEDIIGSYSKESATYRLDSNVVDEKQIRNANKLYRAYTNIAGVKRIVDKYPELVFRTSYVRKIFPDARFVFIMRNGWDTINSINNWSKRLGSSEGEMTHDWWGKNDRKWKLLVTQVASESPFFKSNWKELLNMNSHTDRAALEWLLTMQEALILQAKREDILFLKYESLVDDQKNTLMEIESFCSLEKDETMYKYGSKVLRKVNKKPEVKLNSLIETAFKETMNSLKY